jgi:hypothetical protein
MNKRGDLSIHHLFKIADTEWLVQAADDVEAQRGCELFGTLNYASSNAAHENNADFAVLIGELSQDFNAVGIGHDEVEEDQSCRRGQLLKEGGLVGRRYTGKRHSFRYIADEPAYFFLIVNHQDFVACRHDLSALLEPPDRTDSTASLTQWM